MLTKASIELCRMLRSETELRQLSSLQVLFFFKFGFDHFTSVFSFPNEGEFLKHCKPFVEEGVHPRVIIRAFRKATSLAVDKINELAVSVAK